MISLKKYLDGDALMIEAGQDAAEEGVLPFALAAYGSAMLAMGNSSMDACPGVGDGLKQRLTELQAGLSSAMTAATVEATDCAVRTELRRWGSQAARHYHDKAGEVKELLLVMAQTAEGIGARDRRCAGQITEVTSRLSQIVSLEDLTAIRASIVSSAEELKSSIDRLTAEGKAAVEEMKKQVALYRKKVGEAEELASRDALTGVRNRFYMEGELEKRIMAGTTFCVAMIDLDGFKQVNDRQGHLAGDELLKQFAAELRSACRSTDVVGRWGGDEFVILLDCALTEAQSRADRLRMWVCGEYTLCLPAGALKLCLEASIGLAERQPAETMRALMERADAAMYRQKSDTCKSPSGGGRAA